jgi:diadenosine tetraphosphate (Ap4A) HIT family hydrolase
MAAMRTALLLLAAAMAVNAATECACTPTEPESMKARQCSLCREAEARPESDTVFFLKDINPRKPNRWLALPRRHGSGLHHLHDLSKADRTALWKAAIDRSKQTWGDAWGVAYNGEKVRTQCHTHVHIGRMMPHVENSKFIVVRRIEDIPAPPGEGLWIHGVPDGRMHVHTGEQTTETVLMR